MDPIGFQKKLEDLVNLVGSLTKTTKEKHVNSPNFRNAPHVINHASRKMPHPDYQPRPETKQQQPHLASPYRLPTFDGSSNPYDFKEWVRRLDDYFESHCIPESHQVNIARSLLSDHACQFWMRLEDRKESRGEYSTWKDMRQELKLNYLPSTRDQPSNFRIRSPHVHQTFGYGTLKNPTRGSRAYSPSTHQSDSANSSPHHTAVIHFSASFVETNRGHHYSRDHLSFSNLRVAAPPCRSLPSLDGQTSLGSSVGSVHYDSPLRPTHNHPSQPLASPDLDPASVNLIENRIRKEMSPEPETECIHFVDANDITDDKGFFEDETEVTKLDSLYDLNPDLGVLEPLDLDTLVHLDPNDIKDIPLDKVCLDDINLISKEADLTLNPLKLSLEDSDFIISPNKTTPNNSGLILNNSDVNNLESEVSQLDLLHELDPNLIDPESFELRVITKHDPIENINMSSEDSNLNLKDSEPNFNNEPPLTLLDPNLGVAPLDLHLKESVLPDWADHITPPTNLNENISPHFHVVPTSTLDTLPRLLSPIPTGDSLGYVIMFESNDPSSYHTPDSYILPTTSLSFPVKDLPSPSWLTLLDHLTTLRRLSVTLAETPYGDALLAKDVFIAPPTPVPLNRETFCPLILRLVPKLIIGIETFPSLTPSAPTSSSLGRHPSSLPLAHGHHSPPLPSPRPATHPLLAALPLHLSSPGKPCMEDPDVDHEFLYDEQGRVDILQSPFFNVTFGSDRTVDEYVDRIIYQLTFAIEDRIPQGRWYLIGRPSTPPNLAPNPATTTRGTSFRR
ncbi:hypothetical protein M5K25_000148 [Dendrobium thyrsiflorum]|uniref:Retrotransposon gag domain-containing protein n=1 Tax=Dendrobium thyrsiflorum TaxID=117978 RepID=A0ABD0VTM6_DENTH